jgi:hypothetical protein
MEEFEDLKKIYLDKEKENLKLKEELSNMKGKYFISEKQKSLNEEEVKFEANNSRLQGSSDQNDQADPENKYSEDNVSNYLGFNLNKQFVMSQKHSSNTNNVKFNAYNYSDNFSNLQYQAQQQENHEISSSVDSPIPQSKEKFFSTKVRRDFYIQTDKAMDLGRIYDEAIFREKTKIGKNSILDEITENHNVS